MKTEVAEVACARCKTKIPIEEAYHREPKGFQCQKCYGYDRQTDWFIGIGIIIILFIFALAGG